MVLNSAVPITQNSCLLTKIKMQLHSCFTHSQRCAFQQHSRVLYSSWHARDIKRRKLKSTGPSMPLFHLHLLGSALLYSVLFHCSWAPHQCGWDHYSNTAQKNPVMSFVCNTKQTMDDMEVMVTSAPHHWSSVCLVPKMAGLSLVKEWSIGGMRSADVSFSARLSLTETWSQVLPPNGKPPKQWHWAKPGRCYWKRSCLKVWVSWSEDDYHLLVQNDELN